MTLDLPVPFFANTSDNTHCFQASLKMILKYFWPNKDFSWAELDTIFAKVKNLWTWPIAGMLWLKEQGFEVIDSEVFDYQEFAQRGGDYLVEFYGSEAAVKQIANSDIPQEKRLEQKLVNQKIVRTELPSIPQIPEFLKAGYLVCCNVNSSALEDRPGYLGHFVIIKGFTDTELILHDPGLPARQNRRVSFADFERAWAYPEEKAKNILAVKWKN